MKYARMITLLIFTILLNGCGYIDTIGDIKSEVSTAIQYYNDAKIRQLIQYKIEYLAANSQEKLELRDEIISVFSDYDEERLPDELKGFLDMIRG